VVIKASFYLSKFCYNVLAEFRTNIISLIKIKNRPMNIIEIVEVSKLPLDPELYFGGNVDIPVAGSVTEEYNLEIAGWCLPKNNRQVQIEILYSGSLQAETGLNLVRDDVNAHFTSQQIPVPEKTGFSIGFKTFHLARNFELTVDLVLPDKDKREKRTTIAKIKGTQVPLTPTFKPTIQPIMVYGPGRSGSTWVMNLLGMHPEVVIDPHHPYEVFGMTYWLQLARILGSPADLKNSATPDAAYLTNPNWVGSNPYNRSPMIDPPAVKHWFRQQYVNDLVDFSLRSIENFNHSLAVSQNKPRARYFAEKYLIGSEIDWVPQQVWQLYPHAKEIFLVRDFRDWFCSLRSFNLKRGFENFGEYSNLTEAEFVELVRKRSSWLLANWEFRKNKSFLLRYEDLVAKPRETLRSVFSYLELDASPAFIEDILQRSSGNTAELQQHKTSQDLNSSVGRWKRDLNPELQATLNREYAEILTGFGYKI